MAKNIFIVAGDASGDVYGAQLISELRKIEPDIEIAGLGGDHMAATGMVFLYHLVREFSVVGFLPVILGMPKVMRFLEITLNYIDRHRPDALVLIDYPGFNLYLATHMEKRNIPVVYYVTPQIWAWASWRIHKIKRFVRKMLVIFPFEVDFYQKADVPVEYVGHPLLDKMALFKPQLSFKKQRCPQNSKILGFLPGSRTIEILLNLPLMLWIAREIATETDIDRIWIAQASSKHQSLICNLLEQNRNQLPGVDLIIGDTYDAIYHSHFLLATSGTVTLETAMMQKPMVVLYRVRFYHKWVFEHTSWVKCKYFGLPNIIAGKKIVPEYAVCESAPHYLLDDVRNLWNDTALRRQCLEDLSTLKAKLEQPGASQKAARAIMALIS